MSGRQLYSTGSVYEPVIGCSRAVRTGDHLAISACAPLGPDGKTTAAPYAYGQAKRCLAIIAGVVGEVFGRIRPACAFIQVVGFASPEWHLEIEADCHRSG